MGSNVGDRLAYLQGVVDAAGDTAVAVSAVYETAPWGPVRQDDYLNAVLIADDPQCDPYGWLDFGRQCERRAGRTRELRWGPRTLDVDIIDVDGSIASGGIASGASADPELILPHPRAGQRAFVLVPWLDADPHASLAGIPVADLLHTLDPVERAGVRRRDDLGLRRHAHRGEP